MAIRGLLDKQVVEIIQQWKHEIHDQDTSNGNVQILESMAGECKNRLITVAEERIRKLQRRNSQEEKEKAVKKRRGFPNVVWGTINGQITERMQELGSYIDQDVNQRLRGMCELFRADVSNQVARFNEMQQKLEQWIENVVNAAGDRLVENDHRNNNQEWALGQINASLLGLNGKMEQNRKRYPTNPRKTNTGGGKSGSRK